MRIIIMHLCVCAQYFYFLLRIKSSTLIRLNFSSNCEKNEGNMLVYHDNDPI